MHYFRTLQKSAEMIHSVTVEEFQDFVRLAAE